MMFRSRTFNYWGRKFPDDAPRTKPWKFDLEENQRRGAERSRNFRKAVGLPEEDDHEPQP